MRVTSCGQTMHIGSQACEDEWRICRFIPVFGMQALIVFGIAMAAVNLMLPSLSAAIPVVALGAGVLTMLALLGAAQFTGVISELLGKSNAGLVVLDVKTQSIVSYTGRLFGSRRQQFSFDDVVEVSSIRQRWDGQSLSSGTAIKMYSGENVVIPEKLESLEILIVGYFIGLQDSSLELSPA
ncbi:MAG: hypothetical protein AAGD43_06155 [Pseudomonadota bacterium]